MLEQAWEGNRLWFEHGMPLQVPTVGLSQLVLLLMEVVESVQRRSFP